MTDTKTFPVLGSNSGLDEDLERDLRARINPLYEDVRGTESYERKRVLGEIDRLRNRINAAPVAIMDTRDALGICAPTEDAFPALYALQGKRVRLVLDEVPNVKVSEGENGK